MCGIGGFYGPEARATDVLTSMAGQLIHRGPDAEGFFHKGHIGFAHRRLSIIDLSERANQPMTSASGRWVLMFNGELFNFRELAATLHVKLRTHSDTEVMVECFDQYGPQIVEKFNGMFAIAAYDHQQDRLFLFRDRIGVKPLFYAHIDGIWYFASEIKALATLVPLRRKLTLDVDAIPLYLQLGYIPHPRTIWNEIKKFPAGYYVSIGPSTATWHCYWRPEDQIEANPLTQAHDALQQVDDMLHSAVRYRLVSDVPFGAFFSGGIDSTLIVSIAQKQLSVPLKTFTIGFDDSAHDESHYAERIASFLKTDHHTYRVSWQDAVMLATQAMDIMDEPMADSSTIPTMLVAQLARRQVKMVLSGDGGDELFFGYGMYRWARRLTHPVVRRLYGPLANLLPLLGNRYHRIARLFEHADSLYEHIFSQEQSMFSRHETRRLLGDSLRTSHLEPLQPTARRLSVVEQHALMDLIYYLRDDLLVKIDRSTMRVGLECRTPFLDYRLVRLALNISEDMKMRHGTLKWLLRQLLHRYVPAHLFERPKQGFSVPLARWLSHELNPLLENLLSEESVRKTALLDWQEVLALKKSFYHGRSYLCHRLWNLMTLQHWLLKNHR